MDGCPRKIAAGIRESKDDPFALLDRQTVRSFHCQEWEDRFGGLDLEKTVAAIEVENLPDMAFNGPVVVGVGAEHPFVLIIAE